MDRNNSVKKIKEFVQKNNKFCIDLKDTFPLIIIEQVFVA